MPISNQVNATVPADVLADCVTKLKAVSAALEPYLHTLTKDEKAAMPKLGDKSLAFVEKAVELCKTNPDFVPSFLSPAELNSDLNLLKQLRPVASLAGQLSNALEDASITAGSEAYQQALVLYMAIKGAVKAGRPGAEVLHSDLQERFPGVSRKKAPPTNG